MLQIVKLPPPSTRGRISLEETIARRRSVRRYQPAPLTISQLGQILWSAQGITGTGKLRAAPSAGATYPLEILVVVGKQTISIIASQNNVIASEERQSPDEKDLPAGIYHYEGDSHSLRLHLQGDFRMDLARAAMDQGFIAAAPVNIVICALYSRTHYTYGRRSERYVHMEVGHVGENIHLQAVALGLATVEVGAFDDEMVRKILVVDEEIKPLYIMPVGKLRQRAIN